MNQDIAKIIDFLYSEPSIPEDLLLQIQEWMNRNKDNREVTAALVNLWDEEYGMNAGAVSADAIARLLTEVENSQSPKSIQHIPTFKCWMRYVAVAVIAMLIGVASYTIGSNSSGQETILLTAQGSAGTFTLPDGSVVRLNSDSKLTYNSSDFLKSDTRNVRIEGEAYFDVTKDKNHPFIVEMADMKVQVLGTTFEVRDYSFSGVKEVVLLSGKVEVSTPDTKEAAVLYPDQRLTYNTKTGKCNIEDADAETYCRWIHPRLKLENEPLGDILITIGRKYCVDLQIDPGIDLTQCLSITLANDDIDDIMSAIAFLTDVDYKLSGNTLTIIPLQ